jgi:CubicO group peptidase (beta-lactamase class C family)
VRKRSQTSMIALTRFAAAIILSFAAGSHCSGQAKGAAIDTLMHRLAARGQFNGSVLVAEHGKVIFEGGFGNADAGQGIPFTPATPCYLASLTKQFTAMAIMILAEQHKLAYGDSLPNYLPALPHYARNVTIRHLLNHTSGIPDYARLGLEHPGLTNREVVSKLETLDSLNFPPGSRFEYTNSGYVLLASIIERVSGQPYSVFLKRNIFEPLGMKATVVCDESHPEIRGRARGYNRFGDPDDYDLQTVGEGGIYTSVQDMFTWDEALYTDKLVRPATLAEAFTPPNLADGGASSYGFGWVIGRYNGELTASHAGRYGGFNTYIKRFLAGRNTIVFLTNHDFKNMGTIGNALINILYERPLTLPRLSVAEFLYATYKAEGIAGALRGYDSLRGRNDTSYDFSESELNELGYQFLGMKKYPEAVQILKLNAREFPGSSNVYDGLGEAYMDNGDRDLAIKNYRRSLELDPGNSNGVSMLKKLDAK